LADAALRLEIFERRATRCHTRALALPMPEQRIERLRRNVRRKSTPPHT
jgi:hypothetical protein